MRLVNNVMQETEIGRKEVTEITESGESQIVNSIMQMLVSKVNYIKRKVQERHFARKKTEAI